jgi:hypothetical protein
MATYCTYRGQEHEVLGFGCNSDKKMKDFCLLNKFTVQTTDPYGRHTTVDLVSCSNFRQAE